MSDSANQHFRRLYESYSDAIFRHCYYRLNDRERALDLVQDTFLRTWQYLGAGHTIDNMRAFLYRVANNLIIDDRRKKQLLSLDQLKEDGFEPASNADQRLKNTIEAGDVLSTLNRLEPNEREVVLMRYVNDLKPKEIAEILDESPNVISVRLHRAVKHLREILRTHE